MPASISTRLFQWVRCHTLVEEADSLDWAYLWGNALFDCEVPEAERCETLDEFRSLMHSLGIKGMQFPTTVRRKKRALAAC